MILLRWLVGLLLVGTLASCSSSSRERGGGSVPDIKVLLADAPTPVTVRVTGPYVVATISGQTMLRVGESSAITLVRRGGSIEVRADGQSAVAEDDLQIRPGTNAFIELDGVRYAGQLNAVRGPSGKVLLINQLPLERYLEGVLPHEIGSPGAEAFAAMKVQALTARTYALSRMMEREGRPFHVYSGVRDQVYGGVSRENKLASAAVRETRGRTVTAGGKLARTYYSATCGGHTSDIRRMWPQREPANYLAGVRDRVGGGATLCSGVNKFRWRFTFSGRELGQTLRQTLPNELGVDRDRVGQLKDLRITRRSPSGRVESLEIVTTKETFVARADRIRWVLMTEPSVSRILPSTLFDLELKHRDGVLTSISIVGGGNGHGVGMCQNGALEMARRGFTAEMILEHYYPGVSIDREY